MTIMTSVIVPTDKLDKVLRDMEMLVEDVALLMNQEEVVKKRISDIKVNPSIALSEKELEDYIHKRGL